MIASGPGGRCGVKGRSCGGEAEGGGVACHLHLLLLFLSFCVGGEVGKEGSSGVVRRGR